MDYPFWDAGVGYGLIIALTAVFHVFISHFAIGGGLYLVVTELSARKRNDTARLEYLQGLSKFFVLVTLVLGALTGVGIWFVIGLISPQATELLIHNFVWGWAIEWTFFVVEIASALVYYYGWTRMSARSHIAVGWIYFVAAWLSLVVINGILSFMLTPGAWIQTGNFWDGFFNPSYFSSLVMRTGVCIMLAGLFAAMVASRKRSMATFASLIRYNATWSIVGLAITVPCFFWYMKSIPSSITQTAAEMMPLVTMYMDRVIWLAVALGVLVVIFGFIIPRAYHIAVAIILLAVGITWFGSFEWYRESIRKPFVVTGFMYANAVELGNKAELEQDGYLAHMKYRTGDDQKDLFDRACGSCHTIDGYRALAPHLNGTDSTFIAGAIRGATVIRGNMPPFLGTDQEIGMIASYLAGKIDHRHISDIYNLSGVELGKKVYEIRCGICHVVGGYNDKTSSLVGLSEQDYKDFLDNSGDIAEQMPRFTGDTVERAALIKYFETLKEGGQ